MSLINLLFPTFCIICKKDGNYICRQCYMEMSPILQLRCPVCDQPVHKYFYHVECLEKMNFEGLIYVFPYGERFHDIIEAVKYKFYYDICKFLGLILAKNFRTLVKFNFQEYVVSSVPIHKSKLRNRGFNQAEIIGRAFAKELGLSYYNLLERVRKTQTQVGLDKYQRVANLKDSFKFAQPTFPTSNFQSAPQKVILVDDIFTTGTTIRECSTVLKNAGIQSVFVAVLAKAVR